ncbi:MAG: alpha/beta hydrolase [Janthinobacterium lividum]
MRLIVLCALLLTACSPAALLNATVPSYGVSVTRDVAYAEGPRRRLDIYRPSGSGGKVPLVVFLYGGSWRTGSKEMYGFVALPLAARGAVVIVPDYRLYPEVAFPAFLDDNARAVAWAHAHASELGADPSRVFLVGHSAGAYNAAMLGLDPRLLAAAGYDRRRLAGIVGLAGPYDFLPITGEDIKPVFATVGDGPLSQPVSYVDGRNPPMLLLAGDADTTVNPRNTIALAEKVRAAGGSVEARILPGIGHIGIVIAFAPLFRSRAPVLDDVWAFIVRQGDAGAR